MPVFRPGKPKILLSLSADVVLAATSGEQSIPWDTTDELEGEIEYDPSGRYVYIYVPGLYLVSFSLVRAAQGSSGLTSAFLLRTTVDYANWRTSNSALAVSGGLTVLMQLEAGETIAVSLRNNGNAATIKGGPDLSSRLQLVRIGPVRWT